MPRDRAWMRFILPRTAVANGIGGGDGAAAVRSPDTGLRHVPLEDNGRLAQVAS